MLVASCGPRCVASSFSPPPSVSRRTTFSSSAAFAAPKATLCRRLSATRSTPRPSSPTKTMAASSAQVELWVKGDPKTETLLDCTCKFGRLLAIQRKRGRDGTTERVLASDAWSGRRLIELNKTHTEKKKPTFFFLRPLLPPRAPRRRGEAGPSHTGLRRLCRQARLVSSRWVRNGFDSRKKRKKNSQRLTFFVFFLPRQKN